MPDAFADERAAALAQVASQPRGTGSDGSAVVLTTRGAFTRPRVHTLLMRTEGPALAFVGMCAACGNITADAKTKPSGGAGPDAGADAGPAWNERCADRDPSAPADVPMAVPAGEPGDFAESGIDPHLAVAPDGDAVVAWQYAPAGIRVRRYRSGKWLDAEMAVNSGSAFAPLRGLALSAEGRLAIAYWEEPIREQGVMCVRQQSADGIWSPGWAVSHFYVSSSWLDNSPPSIALGYAGETLVMLAGGWDPSGGWDGSEDSLWATESSDGWSITPPVSLASEVQNFTLGVRADTTALAMWPQQGKLSAADFAVARGWAPAAAPNVGGRSAKFVVQPDDEVTAFGMRSSGSGYRVEASRQQPDGSWSNPELVFAADEVIAVGDNDPFSVASDSSGRLLAFWRLQLASQSVSNESHAMLRTPSGAWQDLTQQLGFPEMTFAAGDLSDTGQAVLARIASSDPAAYYLQWFVPEVGWLAPELQTGFVTGLSFGPNGRLLVTWYEPGNDGFRCGWVDSP